MTEYDLGKVVGDDGTDGATIWTTTTAPSTPDYTFTKTNLTGPSGATIKTGDIIIYSYYWYSVTTVSSTTVLAGNRTNIRGATGATGSTGATGNGIASISKTGTSGLVDTYTITYTNGNTATFTVTNGSDASVTIVTSFGSTTSDSKVPSEKLVKDSLDGKLNTTYSSYKGKNVVTNSSTGAIEFEDKYSHPSTKQCNYSYTHPSEKQCSYAYTHPSAKQCNATIPSKTSDLTNDGSSSSDSLVYVETSATTGLLKNDGTVMTSGTGSGNWAVGNHSHSGMLTSSDIADNLTTNDATKVLSAKQGKALSGLIGDAIQYINQ